ncbi:MAG: erythromycin esterase [Myxococcales bacterium]|nr:erythromycin esterase [Myxococcales bacterium]
MPADASLSHAIIHTATPLVGAPFDFDPLLERIGDKRFVLLGEATHGTHEFYQLRAELTQRLIREKGFSAIATEGDWPDTYRINRYIRDETNDADAIDALADFRRFPQWMWRNADVLDLIGWLRTYNDHVAEDSRKIGFYGLDLYSLHASIAAVASYLEDKDPELADDARARYACFDRFGEEPQQYGYATSRGHPNCRPEVVAELLEIERHREHLLQRDGVMAAEDQFSAEQNARVVVRAEEYYRLMYQGGVSTWNLRDTHMADTLDALSEHLAQRGLPPKIIVWAHNSHVGDSAATQRGALDELTLGHLCRERHPDETFLLGFSTYEGTVTAASDWGGVAERKHVRPGLSGSYEELFHATGMERFMLLLDNLGEAAGALREPRLQRAIGVVYRPDTERFSHYLEVDLPDQLDAIIHLDETRALEPIERTAIWEHGELPETYPSGL